LLQKNCECLFVFFAVAPYFLSAIYGIV